MKLILEKNNPIKIKIKSQIVKIVVFNANYNKVHVDIHILNMNYDPEDVTSTYFFNDYTKIKKSYDNTYLFSIPSDSEYEKVFIFINEMNKKL